MFFSEQTRILLFQRQAACRFGTSREALCDIFGGCEIAPPLTTVSFLFFFQFSRGKSPTLFFSFMLFTEDACVTCVCGLAGMPAILCGVSTGDVLALSLSGNKLRITHRSPENMHSGAVCDVSASSSYAASGDESGQVIVRRVENLEDVCVRFSGDGHPCSSIRVSKDCVYAGYMCGHLRVFSVSGCAEVFRIAAHCRPVSAIDIHRERGVVSARRICGAFRFGSFLDFFFLPSSYHAERTGLFMSGCRQHHQSGLRIAGGWNRCTVVTAPTAFSLALNFRGESVQMLPPLLTTILALLAGAKLRK